MNEVHWPEIDEDLAITPLIEQAKAHLERCNRLGKRKTSIGRSKSDERSNELEITDDRSEIKLLE